MTQNNTPYRTAGTFVLATDAEGRKYWAADVEGEHTDFPAGKSLRLEPGNFPVGTVIEVSEPSDAPQLTDAQLQVLLSRFDAESWNKPDVDPTTGLPDNGAVMDNLMDNAKRAVAPVIERERVIEEQAGSVFDTMLVQPLPKPCPKCGAMNMTHDGRVPKMYTCGLCKQEYFP